MKVGVEGLRISDINTGLLTYLKNDCDPDDGACRRFKIGDINVKQSPINTQQTSTYIRLELSPTAPVFPGGVTLTAFSLGNFTVTGTCNSGCV